MTDTVKVSSEGANQEIKEKSSWRLATSAVLRLLKTVFQVQASLCFTLLKRTIRFGQFFLRPLATARATKKSLE